jgi:hypothetical protein
MPRGFPPQRIREWTDVAHKLAASDATVDVALVVAYFSFLGGCFSSHKMYIRIVSADW